MFPLPGPVTEAEQGPWLCSSAVQFPILYLGTLRLWWTIYTSCVAASQGCPKTGRFTGRARPLSAQNAGRGLPRTDSWKPGPLSASPLALNVYAFGAEVLFSLSMLLWGAVEEEIPYSSTDSRFMASWEHICPCLKLLKRGKKKCCFLRMYENRNIDLFCLGFVTLSMITPCFWVLGEGQVSCR